MTATGSAAPQQTNGLLPAEIKRGDARRAQRLPGRTKDALIGDLVICRGEYCRVLGVVDYPAGLHDRSPIVNDSPARLVITERGERWFGLSW